MRAWPRREPSDGVLAMRPRPGPAVPARLPRRRGRPNARRPAQVVENTAESRGEACMSLACDPYTG
ncbi:hypothetical protein Y030_5483 [Burkholderia pseudomallei MSHR332]|nr:hypothetical protein Y030_5483 [Burkholderia pseudomallei MSHR332]